MRDGGHIAAALARTSLCPAPLSSPWEGADDPGSRGNGPSV